MIISIIISFSYSVALQWILDDGAIDDVSHGVLKILPEDIHKLVHLAAEQHLELVCNLIMLLCLLSAWKLAMQRKRDLDVGCAVAWDMCKGFCQGLDDNSPKGYFIFL